MWGAMSDDELRTVISCGLGPEPRRAWDGSSGIFRLAVTYYALCRLVSREQRHARLAIADRKYRVDATSGQLVTHLGEELAIPMASLVFDDDDRLERFDFAVAPLEELVFHYTSTDGVWEAVCVGGWSNTTLLFMVADRTLLDMLPSEPAGRSATRQSRESRFVVGSQAIDAAVTSYRFPRGGTVATLQATKVHRDCLGVLPSGITLDVDDGARVELVEAHVPRCVHSWEIDLSPRSNPNA